MTTNKPEVFSFHCHGQSAPAYSCNKPSDNSGEYVRLSDYERLQAELARELQRRFDGNEQASREHRAEVKALVEALERIASWPDGGNMSGQPHIKMFAAKTLADYQQGGER